MKKKNKKKKGPKKCQTCVFNGNCFIQIQKLTKHCNQFQVTVLYVGSLADDYINVRKDDQRLGQGF